MTFAPAIGPRRSTVWFRPFSTLHSRSRRFAPSPARPALPTADLPASACLSSRLPYGTEVTPERLRQVEQGEELLRGLGFRQVRLRHHGTLARVEVDPAELPYALDPAMARAIAAALKPLGFRFVTLDLEGYRTGSLNEVLPLAEKTAR